MCSSFFSHILCCFNMYIQGEVMFFNFTKMQGLGNDYIYINAINMNYSEIIKVIPKLCDRNFGIGADGVIFILHSEIADFKMRIFNADGTEAEMCGNGIRCVGKFVYEQKLTRKTKISIETMCGIKYLNLFIVKNNVVAEVQVDMGEPKICKKEKININGKEIILNPISMGNPHAVVFVKDVNAVNIEKYGSIIENYRAFPNKTNVEFVEIINNKTIFLRVWERGAKETLACGTGACASAVICTFLGLTAPEVDVNLKGGKLHIVWNKENNHVYMKGPAKIVFGGRIVW